MALTKITSTNIGANAVTNTAIGYTPANKAGDTFTGDINLTSTTTPNLYINTSNTSVNQNIWLRSNGTDTFGIEAQSNSGGSGAFLSNRNNGGAINIRTTTGGSLQTSVVIDGAGRVAKPYQPAFSARQTSSGLSTTTDAEQKFDIVLFNTGSYYNASTGRFTAPIAGKYYFAAQMLGNNSNSRGIFYISKNNSSSIPSVEASGTATLYSDINTFALLDLAAGDYVSIKNASSTEAVWYGSPSNQNWFIGYLVG